MTRDDDDRDARRPTLQSDRVVSDNLPVSTQLQPLALAQQSFDITLYIDGQYLDVNVSPDQRPSLSQHLKELARAEKRRASDAGNSANTAQLVASGLGGALAASGIIALATATGAIAIAAVVATAVGVTVAAAGLVAGHKMNSKKFEHEEKMERYVDAVGELR